MAVHSREKREVGQELGLAGRRRLSGGSKTSVWKTGWKVSFEAFVDSVSTRRLLSITRHRCGCSGSRFGRGLARRGWGDGVCTQRPRGGEVLENGSSSIYKATVGGGRRAVNRIWVSLLEHWWKPGYAA